MTSPGKLSTLNQYSASKRYSCEVLRSTNAITLPYFLRNSSTSLKYEKVSFTCVLALEILCADWPKLQTTIKIINECATPLLFECRKTSTVATPIHKYGKSSNKNRISLKT